MNVEQDKLCLICMDVNGEIILCSKCKFVYCFICAEKINKLCSICFRNNNTTIINQNHYEYYDYYDYYDYNGYLDELIFEPSSMYYFFVMTNFTVSAVISFCWIILFVVFGYIGVIFLICTIFNLII